MSKFWNTRKIYPSIITAGFDWRIQVEEIDELGLKEVALFLTGVGYEERKKMYEELEKTSLTNIPFCHLRCDMDKDEVEYLINRWGTKKFNIHPRSGEYSQEHDLSKYKNSIFVENSVDSIGGDRLEEGDIEGSAGVCVDVTHLADEKRINAKNQELTLKIIKKFGAGCNHISPHKPEMVDRKINGEKIKNYYPHKIEKLSELDYLKDYPSWVFSDTIALEMQNSLKKQLEAKEYIIKLLKDKKD